MILSINLAVLIVQLLATAVIVMGVGYLWEVIRTEIWHSFRFYSWYKKVALILIIPPIVFIIGWFVLFVWLGPENCDLIMKL